MLPNIIIINKKFLIHLMKIFILFFNNCNTIALINFFFFILLPYSTLMLGWKVIWWAP